MEEYRPFTVVVSKGKVSCVLRVHATTKWHALDIAYYKYPEWTEYQCSNIVRDRNKYPNANKIIAKF